jgi:sugar phosphate isomerase/epimerase
MNRRDFLRSAGALAAPLMPAVAQGDAKFRISLAEWSIHRSIGSRMITNLQFPRIAREQFGIEGLEFVNGLWEAPTQDYLRRLKQEMAKYGSKGVLIMCDGEGMMGHSDRLVRRKAADDHFKWVDYAAELGCHAIRTNMYPEKQPSTPEEVATFVENCAESFTRLCEYSRPRNISVVVENHGGISSDPDVVVRLMKTVNLHNFGTLPDFGNFKISETESYDRYKGISEMLPYAKSVSAKSYDFDKDGNETTIDFGKIAGILKKAGYKGYLGIEFEGDRMTEPDGILATKRLIEKVL